MQTLKESLPKFKAFRKRLKLDLDKKGRLEMNKAYSNLRKAPNNQKSPLSSEQKAFNIFW